MKFPFVRRSILDETLSRFAEMEAEYKNYRKRTAETEHTSFRAGQNNAAAELLPVYDNLLRALQQPCGDEAFLTGIRMTMKSLEKAFSDMDITEIPAEGLPFDPTLHEAMSHVEDLELGDAIVKTVVLTGFRQGDTVLRHALVIVAN